MEREGEFVDAEHRKKFQVWKQDVGDQAANLLFEKMAEKIRSIKQSCVELESATKHDANNKLWQNGDSNQQNLKQLKRLKGEVIDLLEMVNALKLHILLELPAKSQNIPFKVTVQAEMITELRYASLSGHVILAALNNFINSRAKLISEAQKYPNLEDYNLAINETDIGQFLNIKRWLEDMQLIHLLLYDLISKNFANLSSLHLAPNKTHSGSRLRLSSSPISRSFFHL